MALIPTSNLTGLPEVTANDMKANDPSRLNRIIRLLATQIHGVQTGVASNTTITNVTQNPASGGSPAGAGGSTPASGSETLTIQGTHLDRLSRFIAPNSPAGTQFYETDRTAIYLDFITPSTIQVWQWISGIMQAVIASRPADLGQYDVGFMFVATDLMLTYIWTGAAWSLYNNVEPIVQETHANRLATYPSVQYALSTLFWESDRMLFYITQDAVGTVTVTGGTTVTWVTGNHFTNTLGGFTAAQWPAGTPIVIAGVACTVAAVASSNSLTLQSATTNAVGASYKVASGRWVMTGGQVAGAWAAMPTDLGENDANLSFFDNVNSLHIWEWTGAAWTWGPGDRHSGEFGQFDADPGTGWHLCDGAVNQTKYASNGTRVTNFTVPDQRGFYLEGSGSYTGTGVPAAPATATGTGVTLNTTPATVQAGAGATVVGTVSIGTIANPAITAGTPPVATFAVLPYYRL